MPTPARRKEPEAWLLRIRTLGPGGVAKLQLEKPQHRATKDTARDRRDTPNPRALTAAMDPQARKLIASGLRNLVSTYPFGLLAACIAEQEIDLVLRCPGSDLALIADLVKKRLLPTIHDAGFRGRFWRKGFLRRALGSEGDLRRGLLQLRREPKHRVELIDFVRHDEKFGVRTRRPQPPIV